MRSLLLAPEPPVPSRSGLPLRILHLARALADGLDLEVVAISSEMPASEASREPFAVTHCPGEWNRRRALFRALREPWPLAQIRSRALRDHARAVRADVVQAHTLPMMQFVPAEGAAVYDAADVASDVMRRMAARDSRRPMRPLWWLDSRRTRAFERATASRVDAVTVTNDTEAAAFDALGARRVVLVPNGFDVAGTPFRRRRRGAEIVFVGYFAWRPNVEAALELVDDVLPRVCGYVPDASATLVGAGAPPSLRSRAGPAVRLAGGVPDVREHLRGARLTVIPMRAGGGTQIKVLEACAAGVPIVATPFAVRGLDLRHGVHVLLGDSPADLAELAVRVIESDELAGSLTSAARALVERRYDWPIVARPLVELHHELGERRRPL